MEQNGRPIEIEDRTSSTLSNRNNMLFQRNKNSKIRQRICILPLARNPSDKYGKNLFDNITKTRPDAVHKATEATGEQIKNKIAEKVVKPRGDPEANSINVEELVIPSEKR